MSEESRFAILAGDQIYADAREAELLKEQDLRKRQELYLGVYQKFWDNIYYRKVLCSLPAYLMWDDHEITDGWGSREDSFADGQPLQRNFLPAASSFTLCTLAHSGQATSIDMQALPPSPPDGSQLSSERERVQYAAHGGRIQQNLFQVAELTESLRGVDFRMVIRS